MEEYRMWEGVLQKQTRKIGRWIALAAAIAILGGVSGALVLGAVSSAREAERMLQPQELSPTEIYDMTVHSVVGIATEATTNAFGQEAVSASGGTGFILSQDGYVLTNAHVVEGAEEVTVSLFDGQELEAELIASDDEIDIALLKVQAEDLPCVVVGDPQRLQVGEAVYAIGNPLGELTFTMTGGILSARDREINQNGYPQRMLQIDAAINAGNSGGPLFDVYGNVIGVTTAKYTGMSSNGSTMEGLGFAIPIDEAVKAAEDLKQYGRVRGRAYMGVAVVHVNEELASIMDTPEGILVTEVEQGASADRAGILKEDLIIGIDGQEVLTTTDYLTILGRHSAGEDVTVKVIRDGKELEMTVTLDEKPAQEETKQSVFISGS